MYVCECELVGARGNVYCNAVVSLLRYRSEILEDGVRDISMYFRVK